MVRRGWTLRPAPARPARRPAIIAPVQCSVSVGVRHAPSKNRIRIGFTNRGVIVRFSSLFATR